jgi:hypothetical protein
VRLEPPFQCLARARIHIALAVGEGLAPLAGTCTTMRPPVEIAVIVSTRAASE